MAELSPAAQTVLDAAAKAQLGSCYTQFESIAAAALRAAASQAENLPVPFSYTGESYKTYDKGLLAAAAHLRAIAAELEGQQ